MDFARGLSGGFFKAIDYDDVELESKSDFECGLLNQDSAGWVERRVISWFVCNPCIALEDLEWRRTTGSADPGCTKLA